MKTEIKTISSGQVAVVSPVGRIDAMNSKQVRKKFEECLNQTNLVVFDCRELEFLDSTGLGGLVSCLHKTISADGDLRLSGLSPRVKMIFEVTQAESLFRIFPDVDSAVASFSPDQE